MPYFLRNKRVYLDYASATPALPEALRAMARAARLFGNPGAVHADGVAAKKLLEDSRGRVARVLGVKACELVFTSGLTESNNLAIVGAAHVLERTRHSLSGTHWAVSAIEHDSVLASFGEIERMGGQVTFVEPDPRGIIAPDAIQRALRKETVFVSVGWANNEVGTVQALGKIARTIHVHEKTTGSTVLFHSDAGQAPLYLPTLVRSLGVDLFSLGAGKLYGPRGAGALYLSGRVEIAPILHGGAQERQLRAGTEEPALATGFAVALEVIARERAREAERLAHVREELARELVAHISGLVVNGVTSPAARGMAHLLPHMLNVSIPGISSEYVALALDAQGISLSTKSACREGEGLRSHVAAAMYPRPEDAWRAENTLRFSLGRDTTSSDVARVAEALSRLVRKGRPARK